MKTKKNMSLLIHVLDRCDFSGPFGFDPEARDFSRANAHRLLLLARLVYEDPTTVAEVVATPAWNFDPERDFRFLSRGHTQAFLLRKEGAIFVSFRGTETENPWDWRIDADLTPSVDPVLGEPGGLIHRGFSVALDSVWTDLTELLQDWNPGTPSRLWLTGHSLGAALAELAAVRLAARGAPMAVAGVYGFGKPRVGNAGFAKLAGELLADRNFWIVNHLDLVPRLPPESLGYARSGKLLYIDGKHAFRPETEWAAEVPGFLAQQLELAAKLVRSEPMAALAALYDSSRGERVWSRVGALLRRVPPGLLDRLKAAIPAQVRDHFPAEYLKAL